MNSEESAKPNIVLVLMDNLGWGELGVYGGGIIRGAPTPRLDRLAAEGFRALNFNVEAQCTPSRAALMTGRYAVRTGNGTVPLFAENYGLTRWEVTLSEMLSQSRVRDGDIRKMASRRHTGAVSNRPGIRRMVRDTEFIGRVVLAAEFALPLRLESSGEI